MEEIDKGYCVYVHKRVDNNEIIYVGEGRKIRSRVVENNSGRNKEHERLRKEVGLYSEIIFDDLRKEDAELMEQVLIATYRKLGHPLTNVAHKSNRAMLYTREEFEDKYYVDATSPSGLRWKTDRFNLGEKGYRLAVKDDVAGCLNKTSGYWVANNNFCHRIVYALVHGECPAVMTIDHLDKNKSNNSIENLELVTRNENSRRAHTGAKGKRGEDSSNAKVTKEDVLSMYVMFDQGLSNKQVGDLFDLHDRYVSLVRHGKRWGWLYKEVGKQYPESRTQMKLSYKQVEDAYILLELGLSNKDIGEIAGIEVSQVSRLRSGKALQVYMARANKNVDITTVK